MSRYTGFSLFSVKDVTGGTGLARSSLFTRNTISTRLSLQSWDTRLSRGTNFSIGTIATVHTGDTILTVNTVLPVSTTRSSRSTDSRLSLGCMCLMSYLYPIIEFIAKIPLTEGINLKLLH